MEWPTSPQGEMDYNFSSGRDVYKTRMCMPMIFDEIKPMEKVSLRGIICPDDISWLDEDVPLDDGVEEDGRSKIEEDGKEDNNVKKG